MRERREYFYRRHNVKHVTGFLSPANKKKLQKLAKEADKSLSLYVTRLLEKHIKEKEAEGASETEKEED